MRQTRRRGARSALAGCGVLALLGLTLATGARGEAALNTADIVRFLHAGISEHTILLELQGRGFATPLDKAGEASLRAAGASEALVVAVRRAAPASSPAPAPEAAPAADHPPPAAPADAPTFTADTRTVRVPVSVLDKSDQPVLGLASADFRLTDEGRPQVVTLFSQERRPLRIALALDVSRSMDNKIHEVEEALTHFIDLLEPADQILVITFNDQVRVVQDFTSDRELLGRVLDDLEPRGGTALYDAISAAIQRVGAGPAESKAVVVVTDGVDTASSLSFGELREMARHAEVPVFSIGLDAERPHFDFGGGSGRGRWPGGGGRGGWPGGGGHGGWPGGGWGGGGGPGGFGGGGRGGGGVRSHGNGPESFDAKPLTELADDTGATAQIVKGFEHYTPGSDEPVGNERLKGAVESIATILRYRYLLGYDPPAGKREWRTIHVDVDRPDVVARARKGYYAGD
jgi:Mg-chelatase subunit ChlD